MKARTAGPRRVRRNNVELKPRAANLSQIEKVQVEDVAG
jgi:hypothetical protein